LRSHQGLSPNPSAGDDTGREARTQSGLEIIDGGKFVDVFRFRLGGRPGGGELNGQPEEHPDFSRDAEVVKAIRAVAGNFQVNGQIAAYVFSRFVIEPRQGEFFRQAFDGHFESEVIS